MLSLGGGGGRVFFAGSESDDVEAPVVATGIFMCYVFFGYTLSVAGCCFLGIFSDKVHERFVIMECLIVSGKSVFLWKLT